MHFNLKTLPCDLELRDSAGVVLTIDHKGEGAVGTDMIMESGVEKE